VTFVRVWRARVDLARLDEYERFIDAQSRPMFAEQQGFLGVLFSRSGEEVAVLSFWRDEDAVRALDTSPSYQHASELILETGFLLGVSTVDVYELHAGLVPEAVTLFSDVL
jgi:heme-degrading monooxygenase HmoA